MNASDPIGETGTLEELRAWYQNAKLTDDVTLAIKHRNLMQPAVVAELKARWPNAQATDEERELGLIFSLAQVADRLDLVTMLLTQIGVTDLPPVTTTASTTPATVAVSHVDIAPVTST